MSRSSSRAQVQTFDECCSIGSWRAAAGGASLTRFKQAAFTICVWASLKWRTKSLSTATGFTTQTVTRPSCHRLPASN